MTTETDMSRSSQSTAGVIDTRDSPMARLSPVPLHGMHLDEGFWQPAFQVNRDVTVPLLLELFQYHGRVDNFIAAADTTAATDSRQYPLSADSRNARDADLHKWVEAASFVLQADPDNPIAGALDSVIEAIAAAQQADGYLDTAFSGDRSSLRYTNLRSAHELYVAGHLIQAAIAHHRATGTTKLLDVAVRLADHLCDTFGPEKIEKTGGHPNFEMALVELYRETRTTRYLDLAQFFLDKRGDAFPEFSVRERLALVDLKPFRELKEFTGSHAVRALYLAGGAADIYLETGDPALGEALQTLWADTIDTKMYITGGFGAHYQHEAFGEAYELPNRHAYAETCGSLACMFWAQRLFAAEPRAQYTDILELALYNVSLGGVSQDGRTFFYSNALEAPEESGDPLPSRNGIMREDWFGTPCCLPNIARVLASLPGYFYSLSDEGLYVHLYDNNTLDWHLADGTPLQVVQRTDYPWDGRIEMEVNPAKPARFTLFLRIPSWCQSATLAINGQEAVAVPSGSYTPVLREWQSKDKLVLTLDMSPRFIDAHPRVRENQGCYALARGPIVYCLEGVDNAQVSGVDVRLLASAGLRAEFESELLRGVTVLRGRGLSPETDDLGSLYESAGQRPNPEERGVDLVAIPYYARANRGRTWMRVWVPYSI
jgi:uncharacterized protein